MGQHKRTEVEPVLNDIGRGDHKQIYLCHGERYLCQQAATQIEQGLLAAGEATVHAIDGATEDNAKILSRVLSFNLLPGLQIFRVGDSRLFLSRAVGSNIWEKALKAQQNGKATAAVRHLTSLLNLGSIRVEGSTVFSELSPDQWQKLFGFAHPHQDLSWADRLIGEQPTTSALTGDDSMERLIEAIEQGFPGSNILLLIAENVDKRKKIFTCIKKHGEIIDCSIADGASRAAVTAQKDVVRELARKTLGEFKKTIEPKALEQLFERIGFHPVAVVMEVEKLALYVEDRQQITTSDLDLLVGRTREDAVFELTEAFAKGDVARTLLVMSHLLEDGFHELAIIASLRNYLRRLLIFRSLQLQPSPVWNARMNAGEFQNSYLPALKESGAWPDLLKGHPYALFMSFSKAAECSVTALKSSLAHLLEAEFRLKSAPLPQSIVLEELLISLIKINKKGSRTGPPPIRPLKTTRSGLLLPQEEVQLSTSIKKKE